ncbi:MAG: FKBP-type peptidyl-prolyl cis-trans isomerase [Jiangellales bacterium]
MSSSRLLPIAVVLGLLTFLAGCGSADDEATATGDANASGVVVSTDTEEAPQITIPETEAPTELVVETVVEGDGDEVMAGDLLLTDYAGVLWDTGEEFDSSWSRGEPSAFGIGVQMVIPGWDSGLVGQRVGSRVLLVVPPEEGYGDEESASGIPGGSTLVFALDIRDTFSATDASGGTPLSEVPEELPTVTGDPGTEPTIDVSSATAPDASSSTVVIEGAGESIDATEAIAAHAVQASLESGEVQFTTWESAPVGLSAEALPGLAEALDGAAAGTRVITMISADDNEGEPLVLVIDVLGSY